MVLQTLHSCSDHRAFARCSCHQDCFPTDLHGSLLTSFGSFSNVILSVRPSLAIPSKQQHPHHSPAFSPQQLSPLDRLHFTVYFGKQYTLVYFSASPTMMLYESGNSVLFMYLEEYQVHSRHSVNLSNIGILGVHQTPSYTLGMIAQ